MAVSTLLRRHWRELGDPQLAGLQRDSERSVAAFAAATDAHGSLLQSWIQGHDVLASEHYPPDELIDPRSGSQFYYHSHRDGDAEHGHLHLFWHATASGTRRYFRAGRPRWSRTAPSHLFAISLDARGLPMRLFTVNHWVTDGHWFGAETTAAQVERFSMGEIDGHEHSCRWLTGFVRLYRPLVAELLEKRDARLARRSNLVEALQDRRLETLSSAPIDWAADLDALQAEATRRNSSDTGH